MGWTGPRIAEATGMSTRQISRIRVREGITESKPINKPDFAELARRLDDGWSFKEIQRTYGTTYETMQRHFPGRAWTKAQAAELARLHDMERRIRSDGPCAPVGRRTYAF